MTRYFPDVVEAARAQLPERCVVDGEVVIAGDGGLDFDALSQRIHPAASRVTMLAREMPASFVAFDLLALDERDLRQRPVLSAQSGAGGGPRRRRAARAPDAADGGSDGGQELVRAIRRRRPRRGGRQARGRAYLPGQRAMWKVKHERTGDFVVAGFRWYQANPDVVGSLMLGLYEGTAAPARRRDRRLSRRPTPAARRRAGPLPGPARPSLGRLGRLGGGGGRRRPAPARRGQPLERRQGPQL